MTNPMPQIKLYSYVMSPYTAKLHAMLNYKQLPFDIHYVNPLRAKKELPIGHQVPVLKIGDEARADSTPIALWVDDMFPDHPRLLPEAGPEREKLLAIDSWASHELIPASFRSYPGEGANKWINGWKLSHVMAATAHSGLPAPIKWLWPTLVTRVAFVKNVVAMAAAGGLSIHDAKFKLYDEFIEKLEGGPFLAGRAEPSLPDFSCYPQFALFWMLGFRGADDILQRPELMAWLERMRPFVDVEQSFIPPKVRRNDFPVPGGAFDSPFWPKFRD